MGGSKKPQNTLTYYKDGPLSEMGTSSYVPMRSYGPDFPFDSGPIANHAIFIARQTIIASQQGPAAVLTG